MILHKDHIKTNYHWLNVPWLLVAKIQWLNQVGGFTDYPYFSDTPKIFLPILVEVMIPSEYCLSRDLNPLPVQTVKSSLDFLSL